MSFKLWTSFVGKPPDNLLLSNLAKKEPRSHESSLGLASNLITKRTTETHRKRSNPVISPTSDGIVPVITLFFASQ